MRTHFSPSGQGRDNEPCMFTYLYHTAHTRIVSPGMAVSLLPSIASKRWYLIVHYWLLCLPSRYFKIFYHPQPLSQPHLSYSHLSSIIIILTPTSNEPKQETQTLSHQCSETFNTSVSTSQPYSTTRPTQKTTLWAHQPPSLVGPACRGGIHPGQTVVAEDPDCSDQARPSHH